MVDIFTEDEDGGIEVVDEEYIEPEEPTIASRDFKISDSEGLMFSVKDTEFGPKIVVNRYDGPNKCQFDFYVSPRILKELGIMFTSAFDVSDELKVRLSKYSITAEPQL